MRLNLKLLGRVSLTSLALALLLWLLSSDSRSNVRRRDVRAQLAAGFIGSSIDSQTNSELSKEFQGLAKAAETPLPEISVDQPFQANRLSVFITTTRIERTTKCGRGNAVYDPDLDAIFIDSDVLTPMIDTSRYGSLHVEHSQLNDPIARAYRDFLFLHELGHRTLHRSKRRIYDGTTEPKRLEDEADAFALRTMERYFEQNPAFSHVQTDRSPRFSLPTAVTGRDEAFILVAQMVYEINEGFLFSNLRQSPYSIDRAHRRFIERSDNLLETASQIASTEQIRSFIELAREYCRRIATSAPLIQAEINIPSRIAGAGFNGSTLFLIDDKNELFQITNSKFSLLHLRAPTVISEAADNLMCSPSNAATFPKRNEGEGLITTDKPVGIDLWVAKLGVLTCVQKAWRIDEAWKRFHPEKWAYIKLDPFAQGRFVSVTEEFAEDHTLHEVYFDLFDHAEKVASTSSSRLTASAEISSLYPSCVNPYFSITDDLGATSFSCQNPRRWGICSLNVNDFSLRDCRLTASGSAAESALDQGTLVGLGPRKHSQLYGVRAVYEPNKLHGTRYELRVEKFDQAGGSKTVATHDLILEKLPYQTAPFDWLDVSHPPVVICEYAPPEGIVCSVLQDSTYFFSARTNSLNVIFQPAGTMSRTSNHGVLAIGNGWKLYLLDISNM
jgi:hypothetical protein